MKHSRRWSRLLLILVVVSLTNPGIVAQAAGPEDQSTATPIEHFIVLMQENHSFDNYFGTYPGADGFPEDLCVPVDPHDPNTTECVEPFHLEGGQSSDLDHTEQTYLLQYNDGKMDGFIAALDARNQNGRLAMGYYDDRELPYYWNIADQYVLFDRFFTSARGGSVENHMFWVSGRAGNTSGECGSGCWVPKECFSDGVVTIFDQLQERDISWKFYIQNYDPELNYRTVANAESNRAAQVVWCPLLTIPRFIDDPELFRHIVPLDDYFTDLQNGTLPAVSYIVPSGASEHPPGSIFAGERFVQTLINELMRSSAWETSAFMWTYDDWGGWYDHVPPPSVDEFGYGFRAPTLLVSPYAKQGYIDSTTLDFTSFLKFIEENWYLQPLAQRDSNASNFLDAFDFTQPPRDPVFIGWERHPIAKPEPNRAVLYVTYSSVAVISASILGIAIATGFRRHAWTAGREGGDDG